MLKKFQAAYEKARETLMVKEASLAALAQVYPGAEISLTKAPDGSWEAVVASSVCILRAKGSSAVGAAEALFD
jgi:hypothetical protein